MKKALFLVAFAAALIIAGTLPTQVPSGAEAPPATLQAESASPTNLPLQTSVLYAYRAATDNTFALATTILAAGPNQPDSASGAVTPMTEAQRRAVARATFD